MYPKHMRASHGFEWCVLGVVAVITLLVAFGYTMAATVILAVTGHHHRACSPDSSGQKPMESALSGVRLLHRHRLGIGLLITYFSFFGLFGNIFFR